jgi:hypothetical protein
VWLQQTTEKGNLTMTTSPSAVSVATNGSLPTCTYDNGTAGVGATLTATSNGPLSGIDGYAPSLNDRILVFRQLDATQNGIYVLTTVGDGSNPWVLTRATDFDTVADINADLPFCVFGGNTLGGKVFCSVSQIGTIGSDDITMEAMDHADNADRTSISAPTTESGNHYVTFVANADEPQQLQVNSSFLFNPSNAYLYATGFQGLFDGNIASETTAVTQTPGNNSVLVATTAYVDTAVGAITAGLDSRPSCRVATTAALTATYSNGSSGVGATLTNSGTKSAISIDGVALSANDRVLVKNQSTAAQNGIYTVTTVGSGSVNWVLTRATDFNTASGTGVVEGAFTVIEEGTTQFGTFWIETGAGPFTIGTTAITFTQLQVTNVTDAGIIFSDITTNNVSSTKHGFAPKSPADATQFLNGAATPAYAQVKDSDLSTSDVTTNNASTSKHGFLKKLDNTATHYMDGTGAWSTPAGTLPHVTTYQYLTSGSSATYTTPANCRAIHVEMWGGGGGGSGSTTAGGNGGDTIFNSIHAAGGGGGATGGGGASGGTGGTGSAAFRRDGGDGGLSGTGLFGGSGSNGLGGNGNCETGNAKTNSGAGGAGPIPDPRVSYNQAAVRVSTPSLTSFRLRQPIPTPSGPPELQEPVVRLPLAQEVPVLFWSLSITEAEM